MITLSYLQFGLLLAILPIYGICLFFLNKDRNNLLKENKELKHSYRELHNKSWDNLSAAAENQLLSNTIVDLNEKITELEGTIWNLEEGRDMLLETLDRAGIKPADLGDEEQPTFSDRNELVFDEEKKDD